MAKTVYILIAFCSVLCVQDIAAQYRSTDSFFIAIQEHIEKARYADAYELSLKTIRQSENNRNDSSLGWAYYKAAESVYLLKNNRDAILYCNSALHIAIRRKDPILMRKTARYLGGIYFEQLEKDSASYYLSVAHEMSIKEKSYQEVASAAGMLGETYSRLYGNAEKALKYYSTSLKNALISGDSSTIGYAYLRYGANMIKQGGDCNKGKAYIEKALTIFEKTHDREGEWWALQTVAFAHKTCGDINVVYSSLLTLLDKQQQYFQNETAEKTAAYQTLYETEKKDADLRLKNFEIERQKQESKGIAIIATILIVVLLSIAGFIYFHYRSKQKIGKLEAKEEERIRIARDLHDHLGSNVSYIISKTEQMLRNDHSISKVEDIAQVKETASQIMSTLRETIWALNKTEVINTELADKIKQYISKNLLIEFEISDHIKKDETMPVDAALAIFRCVQEIINNINKHSRASNVQVHVDASDTNMFVVRIKDNGIGFHLAEREGTYGLRNMKERMKEIGAAITIATGIETGTEVSIVL